MCTAMHYNTVLDWARKHGIHYRLLIGNYSAIHMPSPRFCISTIKLANVAFKLATRACFTGLQSGKARYEFFPKRIFSGYARP